jgi:hypothetical protein
VLARRASFVEPGKDVSNQLLASALQARVGRIWSIVERFLDRAEMMEEC